MDVIELPYKEVRYVINSKNINEFKVLPNRRSIRNTAVSKINGLFLRGENFDSAISVNKKNGSYRIIDGNHRFEAMKRFFNLSKANKDKGIEVSLHVYENLTDEKEREIYDKIQEQNTETISDRLQIHADALVIWKLVKEDFPCKVHNDTSRNGIRFKTLLNTIFCVKNSKDHFVRRSLDRFSVINFAENLTHQDYLDVKDFFQFFINVFGKVDADNIFTKEILLVPLAHIYYNNYYGRSEQKLRERFSTILGKSPFLNISNFRSAEDYARVRSLMLEYMNKGYSKDVFI